MRRRGWLSVFAGSGSVIVACSSDYAVDSSLHDAGVESPAALDAAVDAALVEGSTGVASDGGIPDAGCTIDQPFAKIELVPGISGGADDLNPTLTSDELTMYFASRRPGGPPSIGPNTEDIWTATRATRDAPFGAPTVLAFNTTNPEGDPALSVDEKDLVFVVAQASDDYDIFRVAVGRMGMSQTKTALDKVNSTSAESDPFIAADGSLYFVSERDAARDIYRAAPVAGGGFAKPLAVTELNTPQLEAHPVVSRDGLAVYWGSNRTDLGVPAGKIDIFVASRPSTALTFSNPRRVDELNTASFESPGWLSPDSCRLYFTRNAAGGQSDIYVASR